MGKEFSIGCDPEFFARSRDSHEFISCIPFVKGTKEKPQPLPGGGFVMRDNVAVEFGIPPASDVDTFVNSITTTLADLTDYLPKHLELVAVPSANFPPTELEHEEAKEFGCEPDYCAWKEDINEPPPDAADGTFRSCGGHVHVGCDLLLESQSKLDFIKLMDCMHGNISTVLDSGKAAIERRQLYGKAGCFRPTDYGVEYRTMSNFWCGSERLIRLIYHATADAVDLFDYGKARELIHSLGGMDFITMVINNGDDLVASEMIDAVVSKYLSIETLTLYEECKDAS